MAGIVATGDHDPAVDGKLRLGIIEHGSGPEADPDDVDPARPQSLDQGRLKPRRTLPAVAADRDDRAAGAADEGPEGPADGLSVLFAQRLSVDSPDIIFAQR